MRRPVRAFTLIELLVATALFAVLGTMLFQVAKGALDMWALGERQRDLHDRATAAFELIAEDLRHAWLGPLGAVEQDARMIVDGRPADLDGDDVPDAEVGVLAFTRLLHEERSLGWLRRAGDVVGGERGTSLAAADADASLLPTGGVAETLYTVARLPGDPLPSLVRRVRAPIGGADSLTEPALLADAERLLTDAVFVVDGVLWFGARLWTPDTTAWLPEPAAATEDDEPAAVRRVPALSRWDSTRGSSDGSDPEFPYGVGDGSFLDARDDVLPRRVRLTLVLESGGGTARLLAPVEVEQRDVRLTSTAPFQSEAGVDHVLVGWEWMRIVERDGARLTVERGARGTAAAAHEAGAPVRVGRAFHQVVTLPAARERWIR